MKRGESGLSLVLGVNKPLGISSHDVVSRVRRIFGEKRVGHCGTLDPLATGVMVVCVGSATRLNPYLTSDEKAYTARIVFGAATDTDDVEGCVIQTSPVSSQIRDAAYARLILQSFLGAQSQIPPAYSAIKVDGKRAYAAARKGDALELAPRPIEVYRADLRDVGCDDETGVPYWDVDFSVSKGTYIRSLARDIGRAADTVAHLGGLERTSAGLLQLSECVSLEELERVGSAAALDPVRLLDIPVVRLVGECVRAVDNGNAIAASLLARCTWEYTDGRPYEQSVSMACDIESDDSTAACIEGIDVKECRDLVALAENDKLRAIYCYDSERNVYKADCVFQGGVSRGGL